MAFLGKLFKRKPGGTAIGNLIRGVASGASGGVLGGGQMMISQVDADKRDLTDHEYEAKYGQTKNGQVVAVANNQNNTPVTYNNNTPVLPTPTGASSMKAFFAKKWVKITLGVLGGVLLIGLIMWGVKKAKKKGGKRY